VRQNKENLKIHVWSPGLDPRAGGIENYSSALVRALNELTGPGEVSIFAKNETSREVRARFPANRVASGTGGIPLKARTLAFSALLAKHAFLGRPQLIISTHLNFSPLAHGLKRSLRSKYCVALHGIEAWSLRHPRQAPALRAADRLLAVSRFTRDTVAAAQSLPLNQFFILPNTVDASKFSIGPKPNYLQERHRIAPDQRVILTVGRLDTAEQYKGQDRMIRALADLRRDIPNVRYLIVGDGNDRARLEQCAQLEGVSDLVIFTGRVAEGELPDYYRLCDLFALPSTGEGFGIVFLEALACGKPALGGMHDGARDPLVDGELGVMADPGDIAKLSQAISAILLKTHPHPLLYRPDALRAAVLERFGFERFKTGVGEIISTLTGAG
jgi:glycosyltransferase involved in cell wall biosynthesis